MDPILEFVLSIAGALIALASVYGAYRRLPRH
jgi:hypothetical protein